MSVVHLKTKAVCFGDVFVHSVTLEKIGVGSVGVTTSEVFGGKRLTQAVLSGRGVCRVGKKEMSARKLHLFYFIYF
jgi:hypothetical protein